MASTTNLREALTYDDVLLVPKFSSVVSRKSVSLDTRLSRNVKLNLPIVASNMDTVCETQMAVRMAREGGIGILHRFCSIAEQVAMVRRVKRAQSFIISEPRTISASATREEACEGLEWNGGISSLMVVDEGNRLLGTISRGDLRLAAPEDLVESLMTPFEKLTVAPPGRISFDDALELMHSNRIADLPILKEDGTLRALITASDLTKLRSNPNASIDEAGKLVVGAAIGVKAEDIERSEALVQAGVDVLVVDIAHGHSKLCIDMLKRLKMNTITRSVDIIAGNIATGEGARDLIEAGADGLKVGVGPGSICITRIVAGSGVPQLTAISDVFSVANAAGIPIIADGGIRSSGDITKACAAGADTIMLGNMLAGTEEAPGTVLVKDGKKVKIIRGMAGYGANMSKGERECQSDEDVFLDIVPEGVEGNVPFKGPVKPILHQLAGGLRSGLSYCGACNLEEMRSKAIFIRMSSAGLTESHHHDIKKI